jgi:hypothetical protein
MQKNLNNVIVKLVVVTNKSLQSGLLLLLLASPPLHAEDDTRELVNLPDMMQQHMLKNMRDHLQSINEILSSLDNGDLETAAQLAEHRLGMSSLESHGAGHMAKHMPPGMREAGTRMHIAASRFARKIEEGDMQAVYGLLSEITSACVACHAAYRLR